MTRYNCYENHADGAFAIIPAERLPIPPFSSAQESALAELAEAITTLARNRYTLHEAMRRRIRDDLGESGKLNNALESWWELDFTALRTEVKRAFKTDIPLSERGDWERYLADQTNHHTDATNRIIEV